MAKRGPQPEDLDKILTDGAYPLRQKLAEVMANVAGQAPLRVQIAVKSDGGTWQQAFEEDVAPESVNPAAAMTLMEQIKESVHQLMGPAPVGKLRLRVYVPGDSKNMLLDTSRSMEPDMGSFGGGSVPLPMFLTAFVQTQAALVQSNQHLATTNIALAQALTSKDQAIAHLATARATGSVAADAGGTIFSLLALAATAMLWPTFQGVLQGSSDVGPQLGAGLRASLLRLTRGEPISLNTAENENKVLEVEPPPPFEFDEESYPGATKLIEGPTATAEGPSDARSFDIDALVAAAARDPELVDVLWDKVQANEKLSKALLKKAMPF